MRDNVRAKLREQPFNEAKVLIFRELPIAAESEVPAGHSGTEALPARDDKRANSYSQKLAEVCTIASRFDAGYYIQEYPDVDFEAFEPLSHFMEIGWYEGRNPNAFFDTVSYLQAYHDVEQANINPYWHYLTAGVTEGRRAQSSVTPSIRARLLFGRPIVDWVDRISPYVDQDFYRKQLRAPVPAGTNLAAHYAFRGWREGKRPNLDFEPVFVEREDLLSRYLVNPLLIQIEANGGWSLHTQSTADKAGPRLGRDFPGGEEDSESGKSASPGRSSDDLQMEFIAGEFNSAYYSAKYPDVVEAGIDPLQHFFYTGWREGRNPNDTFDTRHYLDAYPDVRENDSNPFWHYLSVGRAEGRSTSPAGDADAASQLQQTEPAESQDFLQLALMKSEFDAAYYLASYPDVAEARIDPLEHFFFTGWRESRNPNPVFDSGYYLAANEDVRNAGLNPFWHYLVSGKAEGRLPRRPGGYKRVNIDAAVAPSQRPPVDPNPNESEISAEQLGSVLDKIRKRKRGLVVSLSHDCYTKVIGGTQIFISDEQKRFNKQDYGYLHVSPQLARLSLSPELPRFLVRIVADGEYIGLVELKAVSSYLKSKHKRKRRAGTLFVMHCALGFHVADVMQLWASARPDRSIYWLHDYSSLCPGFNLLRNDVQFCGAPPKESMACRVCVYGEERASHLSQLGALFEKCDFDVLSPSQFALDLWLRSSELPRRSAAVHPHWELVPFKKIQDRVASEGPLSIAFLGYPSANKGWPIFTEIVRRLGNDDAVRFFHFAARNVATLDQVTFVRTEVTAADRNAALNALADHEIKVLLLLSPWPETFSFVVHEAIAAGAYVFCLADSGNVADVVRREQVGKVFRDADELAEFIKTGAAAKYIGESQVSRPHYQIENSGTTASSSLLAAGRS